MKLTIPKNSNTSSPVDYFCLIDNSGSIRSSVSALKDTMRAIVSNMIDGDTITIGTFSSHKDYEFFVRGASKNDRILELLNTKISARGLTCFNDSLGDMKKLVSDVRTLSGNNNSYFYFLSDGYANHYSPESVTLTICRELSADFTNSLIIGYGNYYNRNLLLDMADSLGGVFSHVSKYTDLEQTGETFAKNRINTTKVDLGKCYDYVWQVSDNEIYNIRCTDGILDAYDGELFAIDESEIIDGAYDEYLTDPKFVYSLAYVLSQRNKANLGVNVLRRSGDITNAKRLQKAFTVTQKGEVEQSLKILALTSSQVFTDEPRSMVTVESIIRGIKNNMGNVWIDMDQSEYNSVTSKVKSIPTVSYEYLDTCSKIVDITRNENRANISFLTVRSINITAVLDNELRQKVVEHNEKIQRGELSEKPIEFPIKSSSFRNYAFVADGDFAFDKIQLIYPDVGVVTLNPKEDVDLFDESIQSIHIDGFTTRYKELIANKAHASVIRWYIKNNSDQKHYNDRRVTEYGSEGAKILEELGLNYDLVFSPKTESVEVDKETADYIPYIEITAQLKGASAISASKSYEKYTKKGKFNPGDEICAKYFEVYDKLLGTLGKEDFVRSMQLSLKGVEDKIDEIVEQISMDKFYLRSTNSWFDGVDKADEFLHDGVVFKVKETKEYV